ncbi:Aste57867_11221 [Aphanomyces stellatus]|uniref:Aste57867_11221 protein n=1 Tax=Aphanomyces stellatus TaxID=120398 RepID=A0A485KSB3_9STRA|nr:hypothetical protein As57867_011179 [Aphanomyces stellatus]VFT88087.1 Aste57867_11221 [Aphanomyces stellatus]
MLPTAAADADGALALGGPFTYAAKTIELWMTPSGLEVKGIDMDERVTWHDVLGASATSSTLTIHKCLRQKKFVRHLVNMQIQGTDETKVETFARAIRYMARMHTSHVASLPSIDDMAAQSPPPRTCLVLINPIGGTGQAVHIYETKVAAIFKAANICATTKLTEREAHATDVAESLDLAAFDFVVCVGGDGLANEVVQGLMKRKDWHEAIQKPLAMIPGGSGNGLAMSLLHGAGETYCPENSAFLIAKGRSQPMDLATTRNATSSSYSFLALSWAFMADVDLQSEGYRFLGSARFTMAAIAKLLSRKQWRGRLSYVPTSADNAPPPYWDLESQPSVAPVVTLLPSTFAPVSDKWTTIEGDFSLFWATSVSHTASDVYLAPGAHVSDGYMHLILVRGVVSMLTMFNVLLEFETGALVRNPNVEIIKTRAYQLQVDDDAFFSLDGERFAGPTVQVEVHRGMGRIMTLPIGQI